MIAQQPRNAVRVDISDNCAIEGELTADLGLEFRFGEPRDGVSLVCERPTLDQFLRLAVSLLATPLLEDRADGVLPTEASPAQ